MIPSFTRTVSHTNRNTTQASPMSTAQADRNAVRPPALSRPVALLALDDGFIHQKRTSFDYGCRRGDDLLLFREKGTGAH